MILCDRRGIGRLGFGKGNSPSNVPMARRSLSSYHRQKPQKFLS
jgi:hypothetical protein